MRSDEESSAERFGRRLSQLDRVLYPKVLGRPYTDVELASEVGMSASQINNLRNGKSVARADRAVVLASLYGVQTEYFVLPEDHPYVKEVDAHIDAVRKEREGVPLERGNRTAGQTAASADGNAQVRGIAEDMAELPPDMVATVGSLVDNLRRAIGLSPRSHGKGPK
ncbi:helix-turn-helix domain-containing protein [Streptomyces sp. NPDC007355]|uniref:helix-turn-helix domain-containing protein n=1 Tax=Streptomyces sp. NPDC007355 TaxID=3364778 RepID=UPI0036BFA5E3